MSNKQNSEYTDSFNNFILDMFVKSFECKDGLIESFNSISKDETMDVVRQSIGDFGIWQKVFNERVSYLLKNVILTASNKKCKATKVSFHYQYGWVVHAGSIKAYLGKSSFLGGISFEIGRRTYFSGHNVLRGNNRNNMLRIGSYCAVAEGLYVNVDDDSHPINYAASINFNSEARMKDDGFFISLSFGNRINKAKKGVSIGSDVWIGRNVRIFHGAEIGNGCVIGEQSLVRGICEPYGVYAGVPAKLVKKRFSEKIINELMKLQWWNWPEDRMLRNARFFDTDLMTYSGSIMNLVEE